MTTEKVVVNKANIKNDHIYLGKCISFFPSDSIGGGSKDEKAIREIRISLPFGEDVLTDIAGDKKIFRKRSWARQLYKYRNVAPGDHVTMTWLAPYHLRIDAEKATLVNDSKVGQTIQILFDNEAWLTRKKYEIPAAHLEFFPRDALGARGKEDEESYPQRGQTVEFDYGVTKSICDIATRKSGVMRPRDNTGMREFIDANKVAVGDVVSITRIDSHRYKVSLIKR